MKSLSKSKGSKNPEKELLGAVCGRDKLRFLDIVSMGGSKLE